MKQTSPSIHRLWDVDVLICQICFFLCVVSFLGSRLDYPHPSMGCLVYNPERKIARDWKTSSLLIFILYIRTQTYNTLNVSIIVISCFFVQDDYYGFKILNFCHFSGSSLEVAFQWTKLNLYASAPLKGRSPWDVSLPFNFELWAKHLELFHPSVELGKHWKTKVLSLLKGQLRQIHSQFSCADRATAASCCTALNDATSRLPALGVFIFIEMWKRDLQPDGNTHI